LASNLLTGSLACAIVTTASTFQQRVVGRTFYGSTIVQWFCSIVCWKVEAVGTNEEIERAEEEKKSDNHHLFLMEPPN
jgi:hypothetical protein